MFSVRQTIFAALAALTVTLSLWLAPAQAAQAAQPATRYAGAAFSATNAQRSHHHRVVLTKSACLQRYAVRWARHMARTQKLVHQSLTPIMRTCRMSWSGENIAYGYGSGRSVVNRGWMHSQGHRENILRPQFRQMGIGAARDSHGVWWVSQVFGRRA